MNFPPINAVDDGVFVFVGWAILSGIYGNHIWETKYDFFGANMRIVDIMMFTVVRFMPIYAVIAWYNIYEQRHSEHMARVWEWKYFIAQMSFYFASVFTFHFASIYSVSEIWRTHARGL